MIKQTLILGTLLIGLSACQSPSVTPNLELVGTWHVEVALAQPVIDYSPAQLTFADDGMLSGNNSCNNFFGTYQQAGNQLSLSPKGNTMKACVDALMRQEQNVMTAMPKVVSANMAQGKLLLSDANGETVLVLSKM